MADLFEPMQLGSLVLANRVLMTPLTRARAHSDGVPSELAAIYYSQRASAGLIVTEATQISPMGKGYSNTPGIHSPEQVQGCSRIVESVHSSGGRIFLQLWHVGRISHKSLLPNNAQPVAPSAIRGNAHTHIATGSAQVSDPIALTASGIKETLSDYRRAAANAKKAGFDGVEVHAANGYLIDQFLRTGTNQRTEYGGAAANRVRFLTEAVEEVLESWDSKQIGVRISPMVDFNDMSDDNPRETFTVAVERLNDFGLGYLHVVEAAQDAKGSNGVAQFERAIIKERQREGIELAKRKGLYKGRKPSLSADRLAQLRTRILAGENKSSLAKEYQVSRQTLYTAMAKLT